MGQALWGTWASVVAGFSLQITGLVVEVHGLSCPVLCGIFPDEGLNLCLLHGREDSLPLDHLKWLLIYL